MARHGRFDHELFFSALADRTRLRLLNLMRNGEVCVCFFAETLNTNNPKISRHLSYLKRAGLVAARRDGKWMHYSMVRPTHPQAAQLLETTLEMLVGDAELDNDRRRLESVCCTPAAPVSLSRIGAAK